MTGVSKHALRQCKAILIAALTAMPAPAGAQEPHAATAPAAVPAAAIAPEALVPATPMTPPSADAAPPDEQAIRAIVRREAEGVGLPPEIAEAVTQVESGFNARAVGGVGEIGLMQVLPSTARMLGFAEPLPRLFEPETNIRYGVRYLGEAWRRTGQDICGTVMKYRAGHGETRFSQRSVAYCVRVREILASRGFKVTGVVPVATFGDAAGRLGPVKGVSRLANGRVRMRFNWRTVDLKRKALDRAGAVSLRIAE